VYDDDKARKGCCGSECRRPLFFFAPFFPGIVFLCALFLAFPFLIPPVLRLFVDILFLPSPFPPLSSSLPASPTDDSAPLSLSLHPEPLHHPAFTFLPSSSSTTTATVVPTRAGIDRNGASEIVYILNVKRGKRQRTRIWDHTRHPPRPIVRHSNQCRRLHPHRRALQPTCACIPTLSHRPDIRLRIITTTAVTSTGKRCRWTHCHLHPSPSR
jgi:hypothetical protein